MNATPSNAERTVTGRGQSANNITQKSNRHVADNLGRINPGAADILRANWLQAYLSISKQFGEDPGTIEQASAHEAGHVLVSLALDDDAVFVRARLHRNPQNYWGGYSEVWCPSIHLNDGEMFQPAQEPERAGALMVIQAAGVAGEMIAGNWHPASSIDEMQTVAGVAEQAGINPISILTAAHTIIGANRLAFDTLRGLLVRQRRLFKEDVARATRLMVRGPIAFRDLEVAA